MTMVGNIKIDQLGDNGIRHGVSVNNMPITGVTDIYFDVGVDRIPEVTLTMFGGLNFDGLANIGLRLNAESTAECIKGLRFALMTDDDLRSGFIASIKSALDEAGNYENNEKLSERILDRILGVEADVGI